MNRHTTDRLVELRKNSGYSQEELADKIGVSRQAISKWERGESSPDTDNLIELARLYNVTIDDLINGESMPSKSDSEVVFEEEPSTSFVWEDDGRKVEIKEKEISVEDEEGEKKIYDKAFVQKKTRKERFVNTMVSSLVAISCVLVYLLLGFMHPHGWVWFWPIFMLVPIAASIVEVIYYKRVCAFAYPVLVVMVYCVVGMVFMIWHPTWIMFLSIPLYYIIGNKIDSMTRAKDYESMEDAMKKQNK